MAIDEKAQAAAREAFLATKGDWGATLLAYEAAKAAPAEGAENATDLVSRAEVLRVIRSLGEQDADLALYGAADNARAREYGEAAATRACCAIALMPTPAPAEGREAVAGIRLKHCDDCSSDGQPCPRCLASALAHPAPAAPAEMGDDLGAHPRVSSRALEG